MATLTNIPYAFNRGIRSIARELMRHFSVAAATRELDLGPEAIKRILLVRPNFRMGNSILALPGAYMFRRNFPKARIDFVGTPGSKILFENSPIDHHYQVTRSFLKSPWHYPALLKRLRSVKYDLAVELSCSQSALGAFVTGLSGARLKVGKAGKWDFWYDAKIAKPRNLNKYRSLHEFVAAMGLESEEIFPNVILSAARKQQGREVLRKAGLDVDAPILGVSVGGRTRLGRRWSHDQFAGLIANLSARKLRIVVFLGPEEMGLMPYFKNNLPSDVPVLSGHSLEAFAGMVANCRIFLCCDSGPMHLACALGVRTIAIFQKRNFNRWGPPSHMAQVLYDPNGLTIESVETACLAEWRTLNAPASKVLGPGVEPQGRLAETTP